VTSFAALHDLTGKVAVVTGGSRGIGRAIVQTLAEAGADVVIASRKLDACEAAAEQVRTSTGRRAFAIACHVGRWGDCDRLIAETLTRAGRLDVLVNNAGMSPLYPSLDAVSEELFDKTLAVNLKGPFRLAVLAATHMVTVMGDGEVGGGSIINIGTTASLTASVGELPYACAKAGLNALTVGLAEGQRPTAAGDRYGLSAWRYCRCSGGSISRNPPWIMCSGVGMVMPWYPRRSLFTSWSLERYSAERARSKTSRLPAATQWPP
jgi:hypothetical protein